MSLVFKHRTNEGISLVDEEAADIAVLDLDLEDSLHAFHSVRARRPEFRAIGISSNPDIELDGLLVLGKPIAAGRLLEAVQKLADGDLRITSVKAAGVASSLSSRIGTSRRRPEAAVVATSREQGFFDPDTYLLGTILKAAAEAGKQDMVAVVSFYGDRVILVDGKSGVIKTNLSSSQARAFSLTAINEGEDGGLGNTVGLQRPAVEYLSRDTARARYAGKTYEVPQEVFMWKLGAMTSRGRLPVGHNMEERVYLRRWPNLTAFSYSDNDMRIIAYWMRQAASLHEITEALGVAEQEVFSVYSAALAAGLAGKASREVDGIWEAAEVEEHKQRGLFSSIMRRLVQRRPETVEAAA